jgi:hypothetical protein
LQRIKIDEICNCSQKILHKFGRHKFFNFHVGATASVSTGANAFAV